MLFDVNHLTGVDVFLQPADRALVKQLFDQTPRRYRRVLVTNQSADTPLVQAETIEPATIDVTRRPLELAWPREIFSLSHVAMPFPVNDPLYGLDQPTDMRDLIPIGRLSPRGERAVLTIGADTLMRLSSNPFFPFLAERVAQWTQVDAGAP